MHLSFSRVLILPTDALLDEKLLLNKLSLKFGNTFHTQDSRDFKNPCTGPLLILIFELNDVRYSGSN